MSKLNFWIIMDLKSMQLKVKSKFLRSFKVTDDKVPLVHKGNTYHQLPLDDDDDTSMLTMDHNVTIQPKLGTETRKTRRITIQSTVAGTFDYTLTEFSYSHLSVDLRNPDIRLHGSLVRRIVVSWIKEDGPVFFAGLKIGDEVLGVNGETVINQPFVEVIERIKKSIPTLYLDVVQNHGREPESSSRQQATRTSCLPAMF